MPPKYFLLTCLGSHLENYWRAADEHSASLIRETASVRLRSPLKNRERKEVEKYVGKNSGSSIWDNLSSHFLFCNLDGSGKVLKLLRVVWKEVISKCKRLYKRLRVVSCDCLGDRCRYYFWRMQVACRRAKNKLDSMLLSCHCSLKLSIIIWSTRLPVSVLLELQLYS